MRNSLILILTIFFQIFLIISSEEIKLTYDDTGYPFTSVCFGSNNLCLSLKLDTDYIESLVHSSSSKSSVKNKYDSSVSKKSETMKENVEIKYNSKTLKGDLIKDVIQINSMEIKKGFFYSIKESENDILDKIEGILGLGYPNTASQEKNSLMMQLYVNGHLDSKIWTIDFNEKNGKILLEKKIENNAEGFELDLTNNEEGHWILPVKSVLLGKNRKKDENIEFDKDTKIKISTNEIKTSIDLNLLKKIGEKIFKNLVDKSECKFEEKDKKYSTYFCKNNNYDDIKGISLIFGDYGIYIPKENVLIKNDKEYEFILGNYGGDKNNVIGMDILKNKQVVFDCEKMKLGLYGQNIFNVQKEEKEEESIIPKDDDEKEKEKEKLRRQPYVYKPIPCVGTYSPEITKSIYYQVFSKINPYRNTVAPFNMINTRFSQVKNPRLEKKETPGPAYYEVLPAFKALNLDKRKYNVFGQNEQRKSVIKDPVVPGPGLYNLNRQDEWNKKSYNVLFINK